MSYNPDNAATIYRKLAELFRMGSEDFYNALAALCIATELGGEKPGDLVIDDRESDALMLKLANKIMEVKYSVDDARFTFMDMADAIVNYPAELSLKKLSELSDEDFATVILYMAQFKRNTYETDPFEDDVDAAERILSAITLEKAPPIGE